MANLKASERRKLEDLFGMRSGYVLNFSDQTYSEFFNDYRVDINADLYRENGNSKAKRMRVFWNITPNHMVGRVIEGLITYGIQENCFSNDHLSLIDNCKEISHRLLSDQSVTELDILTLIADERNFEVLAEHIREAIEKNQPEGGLDRLHTFVNKFIRRICESHGITITRDKPLHSVFGEYVKALQKASYLESSMTERILKSSISVLEAFNDVRNNNSLAHDNTILNYEESLLIFNHVVASIRFIKMLETKIKTQVVEQ